MQVHSTCLIVGLESLSVGNHVRIDAFCSLIVGEGSIAIGNHVHIAGYVFLSGAEGITISDFAGISRGVGVYTRNDDYTGQGLTGPTVPEEFLRLNKGPVTVGRDVVIGAGTVILPGIDICRRYHCRRGIIGQREPRILGRIRRRRGMAPARPQPRVALLEERLLQHERQHEIAHQRGPDQLANP